MQAFSTLDSKIIRLPIDDVDTDQIIPARFLKITDKKGLGDKLFADWRYLEDGKSNSEFMLNDPAMAGRQILLAGDNFGCGSSREHAPWALTGWGFRVIIATSFADIFRNNSLKNGLLLVEVSGEDHRRLLERSGEEQELELRVDLARQELIGCGEAIAFPIDTFSKRCLLEGVDQLGYLLNFTEEIERFEKGGPQ